MANRNRANKLVVPGADNILNKMRNEIAAELGIPDYDKIDKGALPARVHGMIGGTITKRLIELGQQALLNNGHVDLSQSNLNYNEYQQEMVEDLQNAVDNQANQVQVQNNANQTIH